MNIKAVAAAAALFSTIALSGPAFAQMTAPPVQNMQGGAMRGQHGSNHNIRAEHRHLLRIIESLERDQRDYGGHRAKALELLRQARMELEQALQYDKGHEGM